MSYGFDLDEWASESKVQNWAENLHQHMGWRHLVMGRKRDYQEMDVVSNDSRVNGNFNQDALGRLANFSRPIMYERRFTYKRDGIFTMDITRRAYWQFTMAGGASSIWGFYPTSFRAYNGRPYPNSEQLRTHAQFWQGRFLVNFDRAGNLTNGHGLKTPGNTHYVFYKENTSPIQMDLSGSAGVLPAIAVDTKLSYVEMKLGALSGTNQTWTAPYQSDWAVAVGNFSGNGSDVDTTPPEKPTGLTVVP